VKITFQISPSEEYVLAHGGARAVGEFVGPSGWRHTLSSQVESRPILDAAYTIPRTRKNRTRGISFSVSIEHEDVQAAELFRVEYPDSLPDQLGDLIVETENSDGHKVLKKYPQCAIRSVSVAEAIGVTTVLSFDIVAGEVQNVGAT
jgi:hypothetical protein